MNDLAQSRSDDKTRLEDAKTEAVEAERAALPGNLPEVVRRQLTSLKTPQKTNLTDRLHRDAFSASKRQLDTVAREGGQIFTSAKKRIQSLVHTIDNNDQTIAALREKIALVSGTIKALENKIPELNKILEGLKPKIEEAQNNLSTAREKLAESKKLHLSELITLKQFRKRLNDLSKRVTSAYRTWNSATRRLVKLTNVLRKQDVIQVNLERATQYLKNVNGRIKSFTSTIPKVQKTPEGGTLTNRLGPQIKADLELITVASKIFPLRAAVLIVALLAGAAVGYKFASERLGNASDPTEQAKSPQNQNDSNNIITEE